MMFRILRAVGLLALGASTSVAQDGHLDTLKGAAQRHSLRIGPAVRARPLLEDALYRSILLREFDTITPEVEMKWEHVHPQRNEYDFRRVDEIVQFAEENGLSVHGHTLVWHLQNPDWLVQRRFSRAEMIQILRDHIFTVVGRYRGRVEMWDVVNEPVQTRVGASNYGELRRSIWLETIGPEYVELAFRFAHQADPDAILIYNQFGIGDEPAATSMSILEDLLARGTPVHGVGFEMHVKLEGEPPLERVDEVSRLMAEAASLGLHVYVSEMDVAVTKPWTPGKGEAQAIVFDAILDACLREPACQGFQTWGFTDRYTWIPEHFPGWTSPLLFDVNLAPKPAYQAVLDRLTWAPTRTRAPE